MYWPAFFCKKKQYYKGTKGSWNVNHLSGLPLIRLNLAEIFMQEHGFGRLVEYMADRTIADDSSSATGTGDPSDSDSTAAAPIAPASPSRQQQPSQQAAAFSTAESITFPTIDLLHQNLTVLLDVYNANNKKDEKHVRALEQAANDVSKATMRYITSCSEEALKKIPMEDLKLLVHDLLRIFDRLIEFRRTDTYEFYSFWRGLVLKLVTSQSLPLKLFGWQQIETLLEASAAHRPPPRSFVAEQAGCDFVNGEYHFKGVETEDGYGLRSGNNEISYVRHILDDEPDGGGKKLTLFRCTMRSQQKWWFLSEADEEQPGTDRDIDYYQHKSKEHEETEPPLSGWLTCRNAGIDPAPKLNRIGLMVPPGEERNTLEHQLARWAINNKIIETLVLGDSVHREIVSRSVPLIKFLASMCERDHGVAETTEHVIVIEEPVDKKSDYDTEYCLKTSHLLLAWKTCTRKTDAAVSAQIYQLLVSILPSCPVGLAVLLLKAVQQSLVQGSQPNISSSAGISNGGNIHNDCLTEVSDFCEALAVANSNDNPTYNNNNNKGTPVSPLSNDVRAEVLKLLWSLLIHPEASSLKSYDLLKQYVTRELRVEPGGNEHRETYLRSCVTALRENSKRQNAGTVDEIQALKMVKLTHFVLEACPRTQAANLVTTDQGGLPLLLFEELTAFLKRKRQGVGSGIGIRAQNPPRKSPSIDQDVIQGTISLSERLGILRYVYGVSEQIFMSTPQLHSLWQLCSAPPDREEVMAFISSASGTTPDSNISNSSNAGVVNPAAITNQGNKNNMAGQADDTLSSAFMEDECAKAFVTLFCSPNIGFQQLGVKAYQSFHFMFNKMRLSASHGPAVRQAALDTLWRICLESGNDTVATSAMNDLLNIYIGYTVDTDNFRPDNTDANNHSSEPMQTESSDDGFGKRVFDCLSKVKKSLDMKEPSAELAAERCLRILNAAIGQDGSTGSISISTLNRMSRSSPADGLNQIAKCLPHGMRGQACYKKINVMAKRQQMQNHQGQMTYQEREQSNPNFRFPLDLHPLETMHSIKTKVASHCQYPVSSVKPISASGRVSSSSTRKPTGDFSHMSPNHLPEDVVVDEMGIVQGCEMIFVIQDRHTAQQNVNSNSARATRNGKARDLSDIFCDDSNDFSNILFNTLLGVLEALPWREPGEMTDASMTSSDTHTLVWDLLLAMPTNPTVSSQVLLTTKSSDPVESIPVDEDAMEIDSRQQEGWAKLLDLKNFSQSVYVLLAIDAFLQPATEILSSYPAKQRMILEREMTGDSAVFRRGFIDSGGFDAVVGFFSFSEEKPEMSQSMTRRGNAVALRILKCCLFGDNDSVGGKDFSSSGLDEAGSRLLLSLDNAEGLLRSLTSMVVADSGISSSTVSDVLKFLCLLFKSPETVKSFVSLPDNTAEKFLTRLLLWEGGSDAANLGSSITSFSKVREVRADTQYLVLATPLLADYALPWLKNAIDSIHVTSECTAEYFHLLIKLVTESKNVSQRELNSLATAVCAKLAICPRPSSETLVVDFSTGVLCGCLGLLDSLIMNVGGSILVEGTIILLKEFKIPRWSEMPIFSTKLSSDDSGLIDLMGVIFDAFLSPGGATSILAICCDRESRQRGFDVVKSTARRCKEGNGYMGLVYRINGLISDASPFLKHRWGQSTGGNECGARNGRNTSKYSGLKNQGCTCYMNSVLQQLFMMPELRKSLCSAPLPASIRASGGIVSSRGSELEGRKVAVQWESGNSYDAIVEAFDSNSGMHTIRYCPVFPAASVGGSTHHQVHHEDVDRLPPLLAEEFFLSEGRPGKETGVFEVLPSKETKEKQGGRVAPDDKSDEEIKETQDESSSRHLMEEVQRTFIHLEEGSRGRCFDPRALVEACACLKLEFDVWQQNDASEFSTKLLDRLETSLKRWAPDTFRYLDHTFGIKQTKQKICKECGLKTNREEKLLNVDCQIRGKADIHEALSAMCETEIMEGNNQVFCDNCKKNTDTVLRSAISELPNMLILSLKRFDLDYNTFETVKLNSRCAFGQTLNMKRYTLEGVEAIEQAESEDNQEADAMDVGNEETALSHLPDEDYEYKLAGVLVHAGVAQGGHYYSFINDRNPGSEDKWYRFDDEDVTPFDPALIATECFGGKVKKETKWPNGQVHSVESEQFANALMLFYEKVKITEHSLPERTEKEEVHEAELRKIRMTTGYDVFEPDVRRSNATHRWQSFLFNGDFQRFLRSLLHLCRMPDLGSSQSMNNTAVVEKSSTWRKKVIDMLVTFMFDVLQYSNERLDLMDWVNTMEEIIIGDQEYAQALTLKIASKAKSVCGNWLRTYLLDCPDQYARIASVRIFTAAIQSCLLIPEEQRKLRDWIKAWGRLVSQIDTSNNPVPSLLRGSYADYENVESPSASGIGIILSSINVFIDILPRCWRQSQEIFSFIRDLSFTDPSRGGSLLREAIIESLIPARMICFVNRRKSSPSLISAFPGASVSLETAEYDAKPEHSHYMNGNQVMNPPDLNFRGNSGTINYTPLSLFESLGKLMGIPHLNQATLIFEQHERGRKDWFLSKKAESALSKIFEESCAGSAQGMGQREIEEYLHKCGHGNVASQRIIDIIAKYNAMPYGGNSSKVSNYLNLTGFLNYYRDAAQREDGRVRNDLSLHGFRADLSRRPVEDREDGEEAWKRCESIARDVASHFQNSSPTIGKLAHSGFNAFEFYFPLNMNMSEQLGEYVVAVAFYRNKHGSEALIYNTLKAIYTAPHGWQGGDIVRVAVAILNTLASIPDDYQEKRISYIMQCNRRLNTDSHPFGLIAASTALHSLGHSGTYNVHDIMDVYDRYTGILKEMMNVHTVYNWMFDNRDAWVTLKKDLRDLTQHAGHGQSRGDYSGRRDNDDVGPHLDDQMPGLNESEEDDDEESHYDDDITHTPLSIQVTAAGQAAVNGHYRRDGSNEGACKFSRSGKYKRDESTFSLFKCKVSNNTQHWYISIVPDGRAPGTVQDTDFYSASVGADCGNLPPATGWSRCNDGEDPPPTLIFERPNARPTNPPSPVPFED